MSKKVEYSELESVYDILKNKVDYKETSEIFDKITKEFKQTVVDLKKNNRLDSRKNIENYDKMSDDLSKIKAQLIEVLEDRKKDTIDHSQFLRSMSDQLKKNLRDDIKKITDQLEELKESCLVNFAKKQEIIVIKQEIKQFTDQKVNKEEFNDFVSLNNQKLLKSLQEIKQRMKIKLSKLEKKIETIPLIPKEKTSYSDMIITKADRSDLESLNSKFLLFSQELNLLKSEVKANSSYLDSQLEEIRKVLEEIVNNIKLKATSKEILALIENKANIEDTNKALIEIHKELDMLQNCKSY